MSLPTFVCASEALTPGSSVTLGEEEAHHMRVRRLEPGQRVRVLDGQGTIAEGTLARLAKRNASVAIEQARVVEPPAPVHLVVPVADRDRMLWLGEKATELVATSWRPVLFRRSRSVSPRGEGPTFAQKLAARMHGALEQSGGAWAPARFPEATVETAIAAAPAGCRLVLDAEGLPMLTALGAAAADAPVVLVVGPEGGLEADERDAFVAAGFRPVSLGATILRFETAAVAALALARAHRSPVPEGR